ncbi:MAG: DUF3501 family protein [Myxococcota bacterium]|nr:DUF3501 family protein [Myxococcota bacterium]
MRPVVREEILDFMTYADRRDALRPEILEAKRQRRISIGPYLMLLLENHQTVWYQIQEMMRVERIVREKDILHEIQTYNELIGKNGGVGACLLIGINDPEERAEKLTAWMGLLPTLYLELADGTKVAPVWDARQVGDDRLSSVQYLTFPLGGQVPIAAGCDFDDPVVNFRVALSAETRAALSADLSEG